MKKLIFLLLVVAVLAVLANDGGRLFVAKSTLKADTSTLASWAMNNAGGMSRNEAAAQLVERARVLNFRIAQYGQTQDGVEIWTESDVTGLWVLGTYTALLDGVPLQQARGRSIVIKEYAATQYR